MTRREKLLSWMKGGDPEKMPMLFWVGGDLPSVWFEGEGDYTIEHQIRAARELGSEVWFCVSSPGIAAGVNYTEELSHVTEEETLPEGGVRNKYRYETPGGTLTAVREKTFNEPLKIVKSYVEGSDDVPALKSLVLTSARAILDNRDKVKADIVEQTRKGMEAGRDEGPMMMWLFMPMVELTCSQFFKQEEGIFFIYDHTELLEEMMDLHTEATLLWIEAGVEAGVDIFGYSINGYEIYSPDLFRRYIVPQARTINARIREAGKLSWWHCCGRYQKMVDDGIWEGVAPDIMESYSPPPAGDITDLRRIRTATDVLASRGAMYVDYLWRLGPSEIKAKTREIIEAMKGFRHMIGGTDDMLPGTPKNSLIAMRDAVAEAGLSFD